MAKKQKTEANFWGNYAGSDGSTFKDSPKTEENFWGDYETKAAEIRRNVQIDTDTNEQNKVMATKALEESIAKSNEVKKPSLFDTIFKANKDAAKLVTDTATDVASSVVDFAKTIPGTVKAIGVANSQNQIQNIVSSINTNLDKDVQSGKITPSKAAQVKNKISEFQTENAAEVQKAEDTVRAITSVPRNLAQGVVQSIPKAVGNVIEFAGNVGQFVLPEGSVENVFKGVSSTGQNITKKVDEVFTDIFQSAKDDGFVKGVAQSGGELLTDIATGKVALTAFNKLKYVDKVANVEKLNKIAKTVSNVIAAKYGVYAYNETYEKAKVAGKDDVQAGLIASTNAIIQGFIEKFGGVSKYIKGVEGNKILNYVTNALFEGSEEGLQKMTDNTADMIIEPPKDAKEMVDRLFEGVPEDFAGGVLIGGAASVATGNMETNVPSMDDKITKWQEQEGISQQQKEGDAVVAELQNQEQPVVTEKPEDIIAQLNGQTSTPQDGDSIVKELNGGDKQLTTKELSEISKNDLINQGAEVNDTNIAVETLRQYMNLPPSDNGVKHIDSKILEPIKGIGTDELTFDSNDNITLYRDGEVTEGQPNSFSLEKKFDSQTPYVVNKNDILVNTNSDALAKMFEDVYQFDPNAVETNLDTLSHWNNFEGEVLATRAKTNEDSASLRKEEDKGNNRDKLNKLYDAGKEVVLEVKNTNPKWKGVNDADIQVFEYSDGKWGVKTDINTSNAGASSPMSGEFNSREDAVASGIKWIKSWIDSQTKRGDFSATDKATINRIQKELDKIKPAKKGSVKPLGKVYTPSEGTIGFSAGQYGGNMSDTYYVQELHEGKMGTEVFTTKDWQEAKAKEAELTAKYFPSEVSEPIKQKGKVKKLGQKEKVAEVVATGEKTIKQIAEETGILEPNVRRILGVGAKEGTFERVGKGVYVLSKGGQDIAYVQAGDAVETLAELAGTDFKADMIFLDIPYDTPAVKGGNRGVKYDLLSVDQFDKLLGSVEKIVRDEDAPVVYMYSQATSGLKKMQQYTDKMFEHGLKVIGKGEYTKTQQDGITQVRNMRGELIKPEGIMVFNMSGTLNPNITDLNFKLVRPKGYQTEKPAEMLKALIEMTTDEGDVVLDPFAGSGVTGAEAVKSGRKAFLVEKNPEVVEKITKPRVEGAVKKTSKQYRDAKKMAEAQARADMARPMTAEEKNELKKLSDEYVNKISGKTYAEARQLLDEYNKIAVDKFDGMIFTDIENAIDTAPQDAYDKVRKTQQKLDVLKNEALKYKTADEFIKSIGETDTDLEDVIQFHGTQNPTGLDEGIRSGDIGTSNGRYGKGFYLTTTTELADYFGKQIQDGNSRKMTNNKPEIYAFDLTGANIKRIDRENAKYTFDQQEANDLKDEGYDGVNFVDIGETSIWNTDKIKKIDLNEFYNSVKSPQVTKTPRTTLSQEVFNFSSREAFANFIVNFNLTGNEQLQGKTAEQFYDDTVGKQKQEAEKRTENIIKGMQKKVDKTNVNDLTMNSEDPVYGYNGTAWKDYNARYDIGTSLDNAKTQKQFDGLSAGTTEAFNGSRDDLMYKDVLSGSKKVASPDNLAYNQLYEKLAKMDGLEYKVVDGQVYVGKNMSDINKVITGDLTPQEYYNLIGYKPERFEPQRPKGTVKPLGSGKNFEVLYPEKIADLPTEVKQYFDEDVLSGKKKPTQSQINSAIGAMERWGKTQLRELVKQTGTENVMLDIVEDKEYYNALSRGYQYNRGNDTLFVSYDNKGIKFKIPLSALGFMQERIDASGIKAGDQISLKDVVKGKGSISMLRSPSGQDYSLERAEGRDVRTARTVEDLQKLADQLNKAGQINAISRRGGLKSKKATGVFQHGGKIKGDERVKLRDSVINEPAQYVQVLAHELSHAIEFTINGNTGSTYKLFGELTKAETKQINEELKAIVLDLEGQAVVDSNPNYYNKHTEQLARYVETLFIDRGKAVQIAPLVTEKFDMAVSKHKALQDLMNAMNGIIDGDYRNYTLNFLRDTKQTFEHALGKEVGDVAFGNELIRRADQQRYRERFERLLHEKFKNVKDDQALLMDVAESILENKDGEITFGTNDTLQIIAKDKETISEALNKGWEFKKITTIDDEEVAVFKKVRYTPEQGQEMFNKLSDNGKQLVKDFTSDKPMDMFNRHKLKEIFEVSGDIEGWVHRGVREKKKGRMTVSGKKTPLRRKIAGMKKQRGQSTEFKHDFKKQMAKAMLEAANAKIDNKFIVRQLATITKPIAKGQQPDEGWIEVTADFKKGLRLPGEGGRDKVTIKKIEVDPEASLYEMMAGNGETELSSISFLKPEQRYQVPTVLAKRYRTMREIQEQQSPGMRALMLANKFWAINVLTHPGTVSTNALSGGLQYSAKVFKDAYLDFFNGLSQKGQIGKLTLPQARKDILAMVRAFFPKNWKNSPDYIFGGYKSSMAGQFMEQNVAEDIVQKIGDVALKPMGTVESYWKKTVSISEGSEKMGFTTAQDMLTSTEWDEFTQEQRDFIVKVNQDIDTYGLDYDNVPAWMENYGSKGGGLIKPFIKYSYKWSKLVGKLTFSAFDKTLSWQERAAYTMSLATILTIILSIIGSGDDERETPEGSEDTPYQLKPNGRMYIGKVGDQELFIRTSKYPFLNVASMVKSGLNNKWGEVGDQLIDQFGSLGPAANAGRLALGLKNKYEMYTPTEVLAFQQATAFIPAFRILDGLGNAIDPVSRTATTVQQAIGSNLPIFGDEETLKKWRGEPRMLEVPVEPESRSIAKKETDKRIIKTYREDTILSLLTGVYISRINPKEAEAQALRELRNAVEDTIIGHLEMGEIDKANSLAEEAGFTIPRGTYNYYRNKEVQTYKDSLK